MGSEIVISRETSRLIQNKLNELVKERVAPGFQLSLGHKDQSLGLWVAGQRDPRARHRAPVTPGTWFDLASLTKILSGVYFTMWAVQTNRIRSLDDPLITYFPSMETPVKDRSIRDLLCHRTGLPAVFEALEELPTREERTKYFLRQLEVMPLKTGTLYSDVGYMLLTLLLEQVFGARLSDLWHQHFGLSWPLAYGPLKFRWEWLSWVTRGANRAGISALDDPSHWLKGQVQDPRAEWWEGDSAHAGLFGTAEGVELWAQRLFRAYHGKDTVLGDRAVRDFVNFSQQAGAAPSTERFLGGFDRPTPPSQSGQCFPSTTVGHLGYTGASFWMDLESGARVCLLCHRFAPGFDPEKLRQYRPLFHDWLWQEVFSDLV